MHDPQAANLYDDFAPFYDLADLDREPEIAFYTSLLRPGDRAVLELGCGTGRLCAGLAETVRERHGAQARLAGLDLSGRMLEVARARYPGIEWVQGDMTDPPIVPGFDLVFCPFNTLQMLPSRAAVLQAMQSAARLLNPGGRFVFDLYNASYEEPNPAVLAPQARRNRLARSFTDSRGRAIEIREDAHEDPDGQYVRLDWKVHDVSREDRPVVARLDLQFRHYYVEDIESLLAQARLQILQRFGDVRKSAFHPTASKKHVVVCAPMEEA